MIEYARITTGLTIVDTTEMILYKKDNPDWNIHFIERLKDYDALFNSVLLDFIIGKIGNDGWGIKFIQYNLSLPAFLVDIYLNDTNLYALVDAIIHERVPKEITFTCSYRGNIQAYLQL